MRMPANLRFKKNEFFSKGKKTLNPNTESYA